MIVFVQRFYAQTDEYDIKDVELNSNSYTLLTHQVWN